MLILKTAKLLFTIDINTKKKYYDNKYTDIQSFKQVFMAGKLLIFLNS